MFGMSNGRMPAGGELLHNLQGLEGYVKRLLSAAPSRATAESMADAVVERLTAMAEAIQNRAVRSGGEVTRYGDRATEVGRDSLAIFAKEVSANPLAAVGASLAVGLIIGIALYRSAGTPRRTDPARRVRRLRRIRKGSRE